VEGREDGFRLIFVLGIFLCPLYCVAHSLDSTYEKPRRTCTKATSTMRRTINKINISGCWPTIPEWLTVYSSLCIEMKMSTQGPVSYGLDGLGIEVLFLTTLTPALGPTHQPPLEWVPGVLSSGVKRPGREADHSLSSEVKNV
jgi:hypothetical protein